MSEVQILSGIKCKGPACIRLKTQGKTWLLDCGKGPDPEAPFNPDWLNGVDAIFITHDHIDHIGGAEHVIKAGLPIYATRTTSNTLSDTNNLHILPEQGTCDIEGIRLTTGRNGHALGGVWFHFDIAGGLFYSGDWSEESNWFAFDTPPKAQTAILDCSYQHDDITQTERIADLDALINSLPGQILFPVPPSGRAGELAYHLIQQHGANANAVALDQTCMAALQHMRSSESLSQPPEVIDRLLQLDNLKDARFLICDKPNIESGMAREVLDNWQSQNRLGKDAHVIFTGYMTETARKITEHKGCHFRRWNVHPPLSDQIAMLKYLEAQRFAPAFCPEPENYEGLHGIDAEIILQEVVHL